MFWGNGYRWSDGVKRQGREADISPQSSVQGVKIVELYLHSHIRLHCMVLNYIINYSDNFAVTVNDINIVIRAQISDM
jgi:hypothetical protein